MRDCLVTGPTDAAGDGRHLCIAPLGKKERAVLSYLICSCGRCCVQRFNSRLISPGAVSACFIASRPPSMRRGSVDLFVLVSSSNAGRKERARHQLTRKRPDECHERDQVSDSCKRANNSIFRPLFSLCHFSRDTLCFRKKAAHLPRIFSPENV